MERFYTVPEVAEILPLSKSKVYRLVQQEKIPYIRIGRNVRIKETDTLNGLKAILLFLLN